MSMCNATACILVLWRCLFVTQPKPRDGSPLTSIQPCTWVQIVSSLKHVRPTLAESRSVLRGFSVRPRGRRWQACGPAGLSLLSPHDMTIPLDLLPPIPLPSSDEEMELGDTPLALHDTADHVPADDHSSSNSQDSAESAVLVDKPATLEEPAVQTQVEDEAPAVPSTPPLAIDTNITPDDVAPPQTVGPIESSESENQAVVATAQPKTPVIAYRSPNSTFTSAKQDDMRGERDESPAQQFQPLVESKTSSESVSTNKRDVQLANDEEDVVIERVVKKSVGERELGGSVPET